MNIAVDYGNTSVKVGIFKEEHLQDKRFFQDPAALRAFLESYHAENIIVSSVSHPAGEVLSWSVARGKKISLSYQLPLPVTILYATPQTLGVDRIAAVCGAVEIFPNQDCLVIDAGTCITYEFVDHLGNYYGGGISPGIAMRFEAMHHFTSRLPLVQPVLHAPLVGDSTETSMQSGVINGARAEVEGIVQKYQDQYSNLKVILCGGDAVFFENQFNAPLFVSPDLVLIGLNRILHHSIHY
jgi:type III pantothenate kinase